MSNIEQAINIFKVSGKSQISSELFLTNGEPFHSFNKALEALSEYTIGTLCGDEPIGFVRIDSDIKFIGKWRNISKQEYKLLDGVMVSKDFRLGNVTIVYFK